MQRGRLVISGRPHTRTEWPILTSRQPAPGLGTHSGRVLEILGAEAGGPEDDQGSVEFIARFTQKDVEHKHHELALFKRENDRWLFLDGNPVKPKPLKNSAPKVGRNDPLSVQQRKKV